jgi:formylglycine-generating enzyme required for sulfatase activity
LTTINLSELVVGSGHRPPHHKTTEAPQHPVTIAKGFAVSKYELTFADWDACVKGGGCNEL